MRVVVVGATGNVGTSVVEVLAADDQVDAILGIARRRPQWQPPKTTWVRSSWVGWNIHARCTMASAPRNWDSRSSRAMSACAPAELPAGPGPPRAGSANRARGTGSGRSARSTSSCASCRPRANILAATSQLTNLTVPTEEPLGGPDIPARLDQDVEDVAVLVDGPPQILPTAVDRHEHLVEVPRVAGSGLAAAQAGRVDGSELGAPLPDRHVGDDHGADQQQLLDLAEAQQEPVLQPHAVRDDLRRKPVTLV